ncbi:MAG: N-acetylmuramoyl-L-alanine amidase [Defluviitaleaceae bacterium]|nr:N-acetylmuramoyl-L-alanine amidase [Defluviitaleaceae bacterium]
MKRTRIFIDPGHGGRDPGAVANGMRESDIVLQVSLILRNILQNDGIEVIMSRTSDITLTLLQRTQMANNSDADFFISIHTNAGGGTGAETFISATKQQDRPFATTINDNYVRIMGLRNRGVRLDTQAFVGSLHVLRQTRMPAILVELAFIDSPLNNPDVNILRNRRNDMAQALSVGIVEFLGIDLNIPNVASWAVDAWYWAINYNITDGARPIESVTRQEAITILYRYNLLAYQSGFGINPNTSQIDIPNADNWAIVPLSWAMSLNISDGTRPKDNITRQEFITILYRYTMRLMIDSQAAATLDTNIEENEQNNTFNDVANWALDAWLWAIKISLSDGTRPTDSITRQEVVTLIYRHTNRL